MLVTLDIPTEKVSSMMELLQNLNFISSQIPIETNSLEKGIYEANEKPSDFAGIWKDNKRDLKQLRTTAWKQQVYHRKS